MAQSYTVNESSFTERKCVAGRPGSPGKPGLGTTTARSIRSASGLVRVGALILFSAVLFVVPLLANVRSPDRQRDSLVIGNEAPTFVVLNAMTDEPVFLRDFTGKELRTGSKNQIRHAVVVSFWASWCEPCKTEIPLLTKMAEEFKNSPVKIFLMNTMESLGFTADSVRGIIKDRGYTLPCLVDNTGMVAHRYTVRGLPMIVVIDKFGIVRKVNRGYHENFDSEIRALLKELLKEDHPLQNAN